MANEFSIEIKGLKEVQHALYKYSRQLGDRVIVAALKEGAKVVQKEAKYRAPKSSGRLRRGIVVRKSKIHKGRGTGKVGVYLTLRKGKGKKDRKDAFYGRFQEDGWTDRSGRRHPGKNFIKSAFSAQKNNAVKAIVNSARNGAEIVKRRTGLR